MNSHAISKFQPKFTYFIIDYWGKSVRLKVFVRLWVNLPYICYHKNVALIPLDWHWINQIIVHMNDDNTFYDTHKQPWTIRTSTFMPCLIVNHFTNRAMLTLQSWVPRLSPTGGMTSSVIGSLPSIHPIIVTIAFLGSYLLTCEVEIILNTMGNMD